MDTRPPTDDLNLYSCPHSVAADAILKAMEQYWHDIRGARHVPERIAVDPTKIHPALPHAFIMERVGSGIARLRVAGHKLNELIGMDSRGILLSALFLDRAQPVLERYLRNLFDTPAIIELRLLSPGSAIRPQLTGRLLLLPLEGGNGKITRALGAVLVDNNAGNGVRRFDISADAPVRCEPVVALDTHLRHGLSMVTNPNQSPDRPGKPKRWVRKVRARPKLRLVVSNP